ncbi:hypothetical protein [Actinophytocola sp.]|uniref:hypothetical protein n=1 Tax=Actinophytocola sp. TaxID=1872138 RepID=UPI002ED43363
MTSTETQQASRLRPLLWVVLAISAGGNLVTGAGNHLAVSIPLGVVAVLCVVGLVVDHYRRR